VSPFYREPFAWLSSERLALRPEEYDGMGLPNVDRALDDWHVPSVGDLGSLGGGITHMDQLARLVFRSTDEFLSASSDPRMRVARSQSCTPPMCGNEKGVDGANQPNSE
jgi:hypothetical protein